MFTDLLSNTYYGNTVQEWGIAFGIMIAAVVLAKVVYWFLSKTVRRITARTETKLDDILVDMLEEPLVVAMVVVGIWLGIRTLNLPDAFHAFVYNIVQFLVVMSVGWLVARLLDKVFEVILVPWAAQTENDLDDQLLPILRKSFKILIWSMAIIIGLNNAGYDVAAVLAGLGIGGLALAMAAKDTVANMFGGVTIFVDQPFRINDRIKISGYDGTITEIGVRSTRLKTLEGRIVTIPNGKFADSPVENISREPSRKIVLDLGLTYDTTPEQMEQAMAFLREINASNADTEDKTVVSFNGFGDFALNILFVYYIRKGADIAGTQSVMNLAILRRFNEAGLAFAFPTQTLYNLNA